MPAEVVKNAEKILKNMERADRKMRFEQGSNMQLDIFSLSLAEEKTKEPEFIQELRELLKNNDPDNLTPKESLNLYYDIYKIMKS